MPEGLSLVDGDLGIERSEVGKGRDYLAETEGEGRVDAKRAARLGYVSRRLGIGFLDFGQDAFARFEITLAGVSERQPAGRTLEQPRPEAIFDRVDMLRRHALRHAEGTPGSGKTPRCGNLCEHLHSQNAVEHGISLWWYEILRSDYRLSYQRSDVICAGIRQAAVVGTAIQPKEISE